MESSSLVARLSLCGTFSALAVACAAAQAPATAVHETPVRLAAAGDLPHSSTVPTAETPATPAADPQPDHHVEPTAGGACPDSMVLVEGNYCTDARQICSDWMDPPSLSVARCREFAPSECVGQRVQKRFCVDKDEYTKKGETLPMTDASWTNAKETCEGEGKRLCLETEWELACEGEQMNAYSIGQRRDSTKCNYDLGDLTDNKGKLRDYRKPSAELTQCVSPFGVRNMTGNVDEWVMRDRTNGQWRSAMKGGWWMAARNRCRPATTAHDEHYSGTQSGFRCCSDAK